ncbi:alpha/beta fold hydrolase [Nioella sp.]|uniref:alpha/beta fold hydrolase n=1 Tax=Nioella sp. TaxID=1912091 RepID=UPI003A840D09
MTGFETFRVTNFELECGTVLPEAVLAYQTLGNLNADGSNAVVYCCHFGATHEQCKFLIGSGAPLDPERHFIVLTNLSGNGLSSSPNSTPVPFHGANFPLVTIRDNVRLQHALTEQLGIKHIALVLGHSMGALQAYEWAAGYPEHVATALPFCGAARVSDHNRAFLEAMLAILACDPAFEDGQYTTPPLTGLKAVGRAWSAWAPTHGFYRQHAWNRIGYDSLDSFLIDYWETTFASFDANNLVSQVRTWLSADIGSHPRYTGFEKALSSIKARTIVMPGATDAYFPKEDGEYEAAHIPNAEFRPIPSDWGHWAGSGRNPEDNAFLGAAVRELLA